MQTSRVILANEPRLLRGMLRRAIARAPGIKVVGEVTDLDALPSFIHEWGAQWVIVSQWPDDLAPSAVRALLREQPDLSVLGVAADGSQAKVARLVREEETQEGLSLADLLAILNNRPAEI